MEDNKKLLESMYDIGDKLYREMCAAKPSDHATLFAYVTELGRMKRSLSSAIPTQSRKPG